MSTENAVAYQCPCCGAGLGFDPEKQKFACEFCLSEFDEAELASSGAAEAAQKQLANMDTEVCVRKHVKMHIKNGTKKIIKI